MFGPLVMEVEMEIAVIVMGIQTVFTLCLSVVRQSMETFHGTQRHALPH